MVTVPDNCYLDKNGNAVPNPYNDRMLEQMFQVDYEQSWKPLRVTESEFRRYRYSLLTPREFVELVYERNRGRGVDREDVHLLLTSQIDLLQLKVRVYKRLGYSPSVDSLVGRV